MGRRFYDTTLIMAGKICPYCGQPTEYVDSAAVYHGISYGMIYLCRKCDAYVGVHRGTDKALGRLANRSLREWKKTGSLLFRPDFPYTAYQPDMAEIHSGHIEPEQGLPMAGRTNGYRAGSMPHRHVRRISVRVRRGYM